MIQNLLEWKNLIIEVWLMNINIDYGKRVPIYEQIVEEIERMVTLGILLPNTQMPSIRDLACALSINPNTVKKAYDILDSKGIINSKSTKGTFINNNITFLKESKVQNLFDEAEEKIKEIESYGLKRAEILKRLQK